MPVKLFTISENKDYLLPNPRIELLKRLPLYTIPLIWNYLNVNENQT
jgi:hypothetical protein